MKIKRRKYRITEWLDGNLKLIFRNARKKESCNAKYSWDVLADIQDIY